MAIQYLSGAGTARLAQKLDDFLGRRGKGRNAGSCTRSSSFPGDTQVLMADGDYTRIDQIKPGDHVLSHNVDTSVWEPKLVLDQWSHLDRGPPATVTLNDQTTITATDDHLFWLPARSQWAELQSVSSDPDRVPEAPDNPGGNWRILSETSDGTWVEIIVKSNPDGSMSNRIVTAYPV